MYLHVVDFTDLIFNIVYPFDEWIYSDWYITWERLAKATDNLDGKQPQFQQCPSGQYKLFESINN